MAKQSFDRFIPRRDRTDVANFNLGHTKIDSLWDADIEDEIDSYLQPTFINTAKKANNLLSYRKNILNALNIIDYRVLQFSSSKAKRSVSERLGAVSPWPIKRRKKPLMRTPVTVLDMPEIDTVDTTLYRHVIDWGKQGQIATIFHGEVHLWSCSNGQLAHTQTKKTIFDCVKWNRNGDKFAVSRSGAKISIIDSENLKIVRTVKCQCLCCTTTAIEWSKDDKVITGCSEGSVNILSGKGTPIQHYYKLLDGEIVDLKLSCNNTYLLVTTLRGNTSIFKWPLTFNTSRAMVFKVSDGTSHGIKSTTWHPWKESILAVGEMNNEIALWNVNNQKCIDFNTVGPYFKEPSTCILDFLMFNPLSAELLVSFYHENPDPSSNNGCNYLTAFSDLHTRVDEVRYHIGRVPHALWDGTGTKLATVGTDENLVIWNFFGSESEKFCHHVPEEKKPFGCVFNGPVQFGACIR